MGTSAFSASMSDWRLILDPAANSAWNMAADEVLLDGVAAGKAPPTLRFYSWTPVPRVWHLGRAPADRGPGDSPRPRADRYRGTAGLRSRARGPHSSRLP